MVKNNSPTCSQTCPAGPPGPPGKDGSPGADGPPGVKGDAGATGVPGEKGIDGVNGQNGLPGKNGAHGPPGMKGDTGADGIPGEKGAPGVNGTSGSKGERGSTGLTGAQGPRGNTGNRGPSGSKGMKGAKGDRNTGSKGPTDAKGEFDRQWCNLDSQNVITKKRLSTSKNIILIKPNEGKTWKETKNICELICGDLYFPSTLAENNEVLAIMKKNNFSSIWIRISDEENEGAWKDPDNKEVLAFTNWWGAQPDGGRRENFGFMFSDDGTWGDMGTWGDNVRYTRSSTVCELT